MTGLISVVIPVHDHRAELLKCLESLAKQSYKRLEIIVVDDGSKDRIRKEDVLDFGVSLELIRFDENRGAPAARNAGLMKSKGEFIIFLDADAELNPSAFELMVQKLDSHKEASFCYPNFRFGIKSFRGQDFNHVELKRRNYIHTSALIRKLDAIRFDESLKKFQDWDYFLQLSEQRKKGIWIDQELMVFKERATGMSRWLPAFFYDIPWHAIGWVPKRVKSYLEADKVIRTKHALQKREVSVKGDMVFFLVWLALLFIGTITARIFPATNGILAVLLTVIFGWITYKSPAYGLALMTCEYLIGSRGGMLKIGSDEMNNGGVGIRQLFFFTYLGIWFLTLHWKVYWKSHLEWLREQWIYPLLIVVIAYGLLRGWVLGHPFVIADANSWGVLLLAYPLYQLTKHNKEDFLKPLLGAVGAGLGINALLTGVLFYLYSHDTGLIQLPVYYFIRRSGIGEITRLFPDGSLWRIFIQSQVYWVLAFVVALFAKDSLTPKFRMGLLAVATAIIGISFSRSFLLAVGVISVIWIINEIKNLYINRNKRGEWIYLGQTIASGMLGVFIVAILVFFPIPASRNGALDQAFLNRFDNGEAAAKSRWILLPALQKEISQHPFMGSGFGKTVTYKSADPRIAATGKEYTTYAFEWGWHDLWLKLGVGVLVVLAWILFVANEIRKSVIESDIKNGLIAALLTLAIIHLFTPYVNHPLGIIVIILMGMVISSLRYALPLGPHGGGEV